MKRYLIVMATVTLFISCKGRKVLSTKIDSAAIFTYGKLSHKSESYVDSTNIKNQKNIITNDSSEVKIVIIPVPDRKITVDKDGNFIGEASIVKVVGKKHSLTQQSELDDERRGINDNKTVNNVSTKKQEVSVSKKIKAIEAKPNYSWIWWVSGLFVIVVIVYRLYKKCL
ncbi:MAG: hypothetical protein ABI367_14665 [Mucilaginibacter sp.]